MTFAELR